jgi:hypothetical protein
MDTKKEKILTKKEYLTWAFLQLARAFGIPEDYAKRYFSYEFLELLEKGLENDKKVKK